MRNLFVASLIAVATALPASATVFHFTVVNEPSPQSEVGYITSYEFSIDDATATFIDETDDFRVSNVSTTAYRASYGVPAGNEVYSADYSFFTADAGGSFMDGVSYSYFGDVLFSGTTASPTFLTGTFDLFNDPDHQDKLATLTITSDAQAAVPEPASWAMMIGGFGMIGGALRRRWTAVTFA